LAFLATVGGAGSGQRGGATLTITGRITPAPYAAAGSDVQAVCLRLEAALEALGAGGVFVVWRLDRLGRPRYVALLFEICLNLRAADTLCTDGEGNFRRVRGCLILYNNGDSSSHQQQESSTMPKPMQLRWRHFSPSSEP
jgi:hypothetical protein